MFLVDDRLHWSASDLTAAATCEYALLRALDIRLGRAGAAGPAADPFSEHIARLGDRHEARILAAYTARGGVTLLDRVRPPYTPAALQAADLATRIAFEARPEVVYQGCFSDGEFFGYADFVERASDGWRVCDAKLARSAKPQALLQLGAYADQILRMGLPLSSRMSLLLGNGERADFPTADVLPVFLERRERLRALLGGHRAAGAPVAWGDDRYTACGTCAECAAAAAAADDVLLVAGLRGDQRRTLRAAGIATVGDLAAAAAGPTGMARATFEKLRGQARLQHHQAQAGEGAPVEYVLTDTAARTLALLPAPSPGDLFFDFEGDPLHDEGDLSRIGLEYLWGVLDTAGAYTPTWAHSAAEERAAFEAFVDDLAARLRVHPDLHVYHYAPYETSALKRLAMRHQTREAALDELLRGDVFVDLYATVRGAIRISAPSYSIKKLEPLYMGDLLRSGDVADGAGSMVAYREFRELRESDPEAARRHLHELASYNEYDCLSTLRLRDWLLDRAEEAGVRELIVPRLGSSGTEHAEPPRDPTFEALVARSGPERHSERTGEEQAYAMLATALGYFAREQKSFWWEHYDRLSHPIEDAAGTRDVFVVESAEVRDDWAVPEGRARNARRVLRLVGDWGPGSKAGQQAWAAYSAPGPGRATGPAGAPSAAMPAAGVRPDPDDPRAVTLTERVAPDHTWADLPIALVPGPPPQTAKLEEAIREVGRAAAAAPALPRTAVLDLLARRPPRLLDGAGLVPEGGSIEGAALVDSVVASLVRMTDSYVAIQGPPGTGKTYSGSRVVRDLVERHGWRVGVVAQSHAVVENMLAGIVKAGLDPARVGKRKDRTENADPSFTPVSNVQRFLKEHDGCVVGGTAWDFANASTVPRGSLDLLVVDEAGQFALAPTIACSVAAQRLLLLGDPQQLPQVSKGTHAEPVDESALGWLMAGHDTIPPQLGFFLGESYRMHPDLCAKVSRLSYDDRLHAAPPAAARRLDGITPGLDVVSVEHTGNRIESPEEAAAIVTVVRGLQGATWTDPDDPETPRPLGPSDVLVVAPYNAQVSRIRRALVRAGLGDVRVGTVDRFQGQEAPVAIMSMTASSHGDVPRGMGFLLSRNRINVAVSRAKWRAVLVRSDALTAFMPSTAEGVLELGAFIGLCGPTAPGRDRIDGTRREPSNAEPPA